MRLAKSGVVQLRGAAGTEIRCVGGQLWITEEGHATDFFIGVGERHRIRSDGRVVVEALRNAILDVVRMGAGGTPDPLPGVRPSAQTS